MWSKKRECCCFLCEHLLQIEKESTRRKKRKKSVTTYEYDGAKGNQVEENSRSYCHCFSSIFNSEY